MVGVLLQDRTSWAIRRRKVAVSDIRRNYTKHTEIVQARDIAKKMLEKYGAVTARIKQCVTVKCYNTLIPHDYYHRNAVLHAFEDIVEILK